MPDQPHTAQHDEPSQALSAPPGSADWWTSGWTRAIAARKPTIDNFGGTMPTICILQRVEYSRDVCKYRLQKFLLQNTEPTRREPDGSENQKS